MSKEWAKNMACMKLSDEEMEKIPYPKFELVVHVTTKTVQAGAVLGTLFFAPIAVLVRKDTRNLRSLAQRAHRYGINGMGIGVGLGPVLTYSKIRNEDDPYKCWDRCYRIRYNRNQNRVDQASVGLATVGAVGGKLSGIGASKGLLAGMLSGIFMAAIYNKAGSQKNK